MITAINMCADNVALGCCADLRTGCPRSQETLRVFNVTLQLSLMDIA